MFRRFRWANRDLPPIRRHRRLFFGKSESVPAFTGGWGLRRNASQPRALCGAVTSDDRLGVFRPTKDGADKPSRFAKLGRVFARLIVAVRLAFRRPATSPMHATHGPATNGG